MAKTQTNSLVYDTHEAIRRLTDAGMPEPQAEVEKAKSTLIAWMVGLNVTMAGLVIAVVSLL